VIVSQECFEQVQAKLRQNASLASRNNTAHPYRAEISRELRPVSRSMCWGHARHALVLPLPWQMAPHPYAFGRSDI
jgi:hypothetical protein